MLAMIDIMEINKKLLIIRRVSTNSQDLLLQESKDEKYRNELDETNYIVLNELGVSANKLSIEERAQMVKLIQLVESNEISVICLYDRTRLVRDFYEHMYLVINASLNMYKNA